MIERKQYRGCLKQNIDKAYFCTAIDDVSKSIEKLICGGSLLQVSLFRHNSMCFLYYESIKDGIEPESFLEVLKPFMELWPEEEGLRVWAPMYRVYFHSIPTDINAWENERQNKKRVGRIAFLYPDKLSSYVYWHKAIMEEGLFKGDKYQFISLHGRILFSYYEEPKTMACLKTADFHSIENKSRMIEQWMKQKPETHFDRSKTNGSNFIIIDTVLSIGRSDLK